METYIVRVWTPGCDDDDRGRLCGRVHHVGSGLEVSFEGAQALLAILSAAEADRPHERAADPAQPSA